MNFLSNDYSAGVSGWASTVEAGASSSSSSSLFSASSVDSSVVAEASSDASPPQETKTVLVANTRASVKILFSFF